MFPKPLNSDVFLNIGISYINDLFEGLNSNPQRFADDASLIFSKIDLNEELA